MNSGNLNKQDVGQCPYGGNAASVADATLADPKVIADPHPLYRVLRSEDPVHYDPQLKMYLVTRYEDLQKVLSDPITFSVKHGYDEQHAKGFREEYEAIMEREGGGFFHDSIGIMNDPPGHTRIRRLLEKAFTARRVKQLEPGTQKIIGDIIEKIADRGRAEGMSEIAAPFTIGVICEQLGLSQYDAEKIQRGTEATVAQIGRMQDHEQMIANAKENAALQAFLIEHIRQRQKQPSEDMISDLVYARLDDDENPTLTFPEIVSLSRTLLVGGNHTTMTAMGTLLFVLATQPSVADQLQHVVDDERLLTRFIEELLRIEPPVIGLSRMTTREVELGGKTLPAGAHMLLVYGSGNDDEKEFQHPREFDMNRGNLGRHLSFGAGVHRCVGLALARMEIKIAAREISRRLDNIRLAVPLEQLKFLNSIASRTIDGLPLTFSRRT